MWREDIHKGKVRSHTEVQDTVHHRKSDFEMLFWLFFKMDIWISFPFVFFSFFMLPLYQNRCDYSVIITTNMMAELSKDDYPVCSTSVRASELFWPMMCFYLASVSVIILPNRH